MIFCIVKGFDSWIKDLKSPWSNFPNFAYFLAYFGPDLPILIWREKNWKKNMFVIRPARVSVIQQIWDPGTSIVSTLSLKINEIGLKSINFIKQTPPKVGILIQKTFSKFSKLKKQTQKRPPKDPKMQVKL